MAGIGKKRQTDAEVLASIPQSAWSSEAREDALVWEMFRGAGGDVAKCSLAFMRSVPAVHELADFTPGQLDRLASVVLGRTVGS